MPYFLAQLQDFNDWHGNPSVTCTRYVDPRESLTSRGACKECKISCLPSEEACPGVSDVAHAAWNKTAKKLTAQYIEKYEKSLAEKEEASQARKIARNLEEELAKVRLYSLISSLTSRVTTKKTAARRRCFLFSQSSFGDGLTEPSF